MASSKKPIVATAPHRRQPTLRHLRAFQAVARHLNFREAGEALALSQPALSSAVREMEEILGTTLFDRTSHRVSLSTTGALLLPQAEWMLNNFGHGVEDLRGLVDAESRTVRVGSVPSAMHLLAPAVALWRRQEPASRVSVRDMLNDALMLAVKAGEIDIGVGAAVDRSAELDMADIGKDTLVALLATSHRLASRTRITWADLQSDSLAIFSRSSTHDLVLSALSQQTLRSNVAFELQYFESMVSLVRAGMAVGIVSRLYTNSMVKQGIRILDIRSPVVTRRVGLMTRRGAHSADSLVSRCCQSLTLSMLSQLKP